MRCEKCGALMVERPLDLEKDNPKGERAIVFECMQCGYKECQPLVTSFWRRLAA